MKQLLYAIGCLCCVGLSASLEARSCLSYQSEIVSTLPETVEFPEYGQKASYLEVYRLHNRPDELVLEVTAYADVGSWVRLDEGMVLHGCQTGKTYHLQRAEGFVLNEQVVMPDSACRSFTLYFDPLDARDQAVHWLETPQDTLFSGMAVRNLPRPEGMFACHLQGRIQSSQTCRRLLVLDALGNYGDNCLRSIPVRQQKFDYTFYTAEPQVVQLVKWEEWKDGAWYEHPFFVEEGINTFDLPDSSENLVIHKVTEANREWNTYQNLIRKMERETGVLSLYNQINQLTKEETYSAAALTIYNQLDSVFRVLEEQETPEAIERRYQLFEQRNILKRKGEMFSPAYEALSKKVDVLNQSVEEKLYARIEQTPSLAGLYYLKGRIESYVQRQLKAYQRPYAIYRKKFAARWGQHSLGRYIEAIVASVNQMKVGQLYEDYQADDLQGNAVSVAEQIKGKWAVIDLWASWCGPCRNRSRWLIPLYERYKDCGFTIVGIARERKISDWQAALRQEKYPWLQLLELNEKYGIWLKHGMNHAAGGLFLIDPQGRIAAVDPAVEDLEKMLEQALGQSAQ